MLDFAAHNCPAGFCIFPPGVPILFDQVFQGEPATYRYDWNGDGTFEESSSAPVTSHAFAAGFYLPVVQVLRGNLSDTRPLALPIEIESDPLLAPPAPPAAFAATRLGEADPAATSPTFPVPGPPVVAYRFTWSEPAGNETGFNLYVQRDGGPFALIDSEPRGAASTGALFLAVGSAYVARVTAYNLGGESAPSTALRLDPR